MARRHISPGDWERYDRYRANGYSQAEACRKVKISVPTAWRHETRIRERDGAYSPAELIVKRTSGSGGRKVNPANRAFQPALGRNQGRGAIPRDQLSSEAERALDDFGYFRRRYFGRKSTPWQEEAAHRVVDFLETKDKEFVVINCPPGCLSGDTEIVVNRGGAAKRMTLSALYLKFNGGVTGGKSWKPSVDVKVPTGCHGLIRSGVVRAVVESGVKTTYTLTTAQGRSIRATADHRFLRPDDTFTTLDHLAPGDRVMVNAGRSKKGPAPRQRYRSVATRHHPHQRQGHGAGNFRVPEHRLAMEAWMNNVFYLDFVRDLRQFPDRAASYSYLDDTDVVHHVNEDITDNRPENLAVTTLDRHSRHHADVSHVLEQMGTDRVLSIACNGPEMTYDIAMADDPHNFVANGFVVHNSGKSTLFPLEIAAFVTARNRGIRGMIGSASQTLAERYLLRLRNALESPYPMRAESEEMDQGLAFDAETTLIADYGIFKPEGSVLWTASAFIVSQLDERPITEKEPTWSAYGLDTSFIGGRFDICIWDDATEDKFLSTPDRIDKQRDRWDKVAEKRLEPGGLLVLQGQRLGPEDLYRHNLDKRVGAATTALHEGCCDALANRKYHHIVYKAHYDDRCLEHHGEDAEYYPKGCLLDPHRLSWQELEAEQTNNPGNFMQVYQQEDIDPASALVDMMWIKGGTDPKTREMFPGCWDDEREYWQIPQLAMPYVCYMCVDPSPTKMWGITMWVYHPATNIRFLVALHRSKLMANQFFDWNDPEGAFTGLLPQWYERSVVSGFPICTLIFEANAAQRFFLATDAIRRWQQQTGVRVIGHETFAANKLDPKLGPQILSELYRRGLVRLPGKGDASRMTTLKLVEEVTRYPQFRTDDLVMSQWFGESNLGHIYNREPKLRTTWRPSWIRQAV